jgi:hypothetical protein
MTDNLLTLPQWLGFLIRLLVALIVSAFVIVPMSVIVVKYTPVQPFTALPMDYWLLLLLEAIGWFIVIFSIQLFYRLESIPFIRVPFLQNLRNQVVWIVSAIAFALMTVSGILNNHFMGTSLAIVIADIAVIGLRIPAFSRNKATIQPQS